MLNAIAPTDIESFTDIKGCLRNCTVWLTWCQRCNRSHYYQKESNRTKSLSYDGTFGIETVYKNLEMLDANAYRQIVTDRGYMPMHWDIGYDTNFI